MKLAEILDSIKQNHNTTANAELGRILGIDKRRIGEYYEGKRPPTDDDYAKIALATGIREDELRATFKLESAKDDSERKLWSDYLKRFGGIAASLALPLCAVVILELTPSLAEAAPHQHNTVGMFCIMLNIGYFIQRQFQLRRVSLISHFGVFVGKVRKMPANQPDFFRVNFFFN